LFVDDQDRQLHRVVVDPNEQAIHVELADIGVPVRAGSNLALLGGDAHICVDLYVLLPRPASPSTILEELLDRLGDPFPGRGTVANRMRRCRALFLR
jgi:hypothetical protein